MSTERWRESLDDGKGWRAVVRRIFGGSENPLRWGFPLYSAWGILVRIHLVFPIFIGARLIQAIVPSGPGLVYVAPVMVAMLVLVLLHEYGHCIACRRVGGEADEILMWPLGGIAWCSPPHRWDAALWTTVGGPMVNLVLLVPLGLATWLVCGDIGAAVFNPFAPGMAAGLVVASGDLEKVAKLTLWAFHYVNFVLLAFNVLLPMYPMDGGRIVHALLWRKIGHREATRVSALVGLVAACVMAVFAIVFSEMLLLGVAVFGGIVCYGELQRLRFESDGDDSVFAASLAMSDEDEKPVAPDRAARKDARAAATQDEIDRILEKISRSGMGSLTRKERKALERASEAGRSGG